MQYFYNGIQFTLAKLHGWHAEAIYSPDGVDYLYTHHTIDAEFILNPKACAYTLQDGEPIPTPTALPATTFAAIRHALMIPRQTLFIRDYNNQVVLECPDSGFAVDAHVGPKPLRCEPHLSGASRTWQFRWVVECWVNECEANTPGQAFLPDGVLSYRWVDEHHTNENQLTTRITNGIAIFRSDFLEDVNGMADNFRQLLQPLFCPPGFQRTNIDVVAKSDGTALQITVRDEERMFDIGETDARIDGQGLQGSGIVRIDGAFGVTSISTEAGPAAGMSMQQFDVRVYGNKYANQWTMIQRCFELALTKISGVGQQNTGFIRQAAIRESMDQSQKWVELSIAYQSTPVDNAGIASLRLDGLRKSDQDVFEDQGGVNPGMPNADGMRGTTLLQCMTQALGEVCQLPDTDNVAPGDDGETTAGGSIGPGPAISVEAQDELPYERSGYNVPDEVPYTHYRTNIRIERDTGLMQAPPTGSNSSSYSSGSTPPSGSDWGGGTGAFNGPSGNSSAQLVPSRFFRVSWPMERMEMEFECERVGLFPTVPSPTNSDSNLVLLHAVLNPFAPIFANDGVTPVYKVQGHYEYGLQIPIQSGNPVPMGALPWTIMAFTDNLLTPESFDHGIFDEPDNGSAGAPGPAV